MNRRYSILPLACLVVWAAGCGSLDTGPSEPAYQGKWLHVWLDEGCRPLPNTWPQTEEAVRKMGKKAVPTLLLMLQGKYTPPEARFVAKAENQAHGKTNLVDMVDYPYKGFDGLRALGPAARGALPELKRLFKNHHNDAGLIYWVPLALAVISPETVPLLRGGLTNENWTVRFACTDALFRVGTNAWVAIPDLIKGLQDPTVHVRIYTVQLLGNLHRDPEHVLPALLKSAQEEQEPTMRWLAMRSMGQYHAEAAAYIPALQQILASTNAADMSLRSRVTEAIEDIRSPAGSPPAGSSRGIRD